MSGNPCSGKARFYLDNPIGHEVVKRIAGEGWYRYFQGLNRETVESRTLSRLGAQIVIGCALVEAKEAKKALAHENQRKGRQANQ